MPGTLTSANAAMVATVEALYPQAINLQGFSADDAWDPEAVENGEYSYGIDGRLSAGFVFNEVPLAVTFQADSPTLPYFENVWQYEFSNRTKLQWDLTITATALGRRYEYKQGYMRSYKAPAGKKILQPAVGNFIFAQLQISNI
jgi:hypothetical protein